MQDNFENNIRQKMDGLDVAPSGAVWQKVEDALHHKKDRRWLFILLLAALLLPTGYFIFYSAKTTSSVAINTNVDSSKNIGKNSKNPLNTLTDNNANLNNKLANSRPKPSIADSKSGASNSFANTTGLPTTNANQNSNSVSVSIAAERKLSPLKKYRRDNGAAKATILAGDIEEVKKAEQVVATSVELPVKDSNSISKIAKGEEDSALTNSPEVAPSDKTPVLFDTSVTATKKDLKKAFISDWKIGFTGSVSTVLQAGGLFGFLSGNKSLAYTNNPLSGGVGGNPVFSDTILTLSKASKIYSAGVALEKQLSKKFQVATGLQYSFYNYYIRNTNNRYQLTSPGYYNLTNTTFFDAAADAHGFAIPLQLKYAVKTSPGNAIGLGLGISNNFVFVDRHMGNFSLWNQKKANPFYQIYQPVLMLSPSYTFTLGKGRLSTGFIFGYGIKQLYASGNKQHLNQLGISISYFPVKIFSHRQ